MKNTLFAIWLAILPIIAFGQKFEPTTKWPYLYENFQTGTIFFSDSMKATMNLNIHLVKSSLHYLKGDLIYENDDIGIEKVMFGNDQYVYLNNELAKLIEKSGNNCLVSITRGDFDALYTGTGAYGTSTQTAAVKDLSSFDIGGLSNMNHRQLTIDKSNGKYLPVIVEYYFQIDGETVLATRREVEKYVGKNNKAALKDFVKKNKISWKNQSGLVKLLSYFD